MQIKKAFLRNSEIVIFEKKNNFAAAWVSFLQTAGSETDRSYLYSFAWIKDLLNTRKPRRGIFHTFVIIYDII